MNRITDNTEKISRNTLDPARRPAAGKVYEKPRLRALSLFADEVMGNCNLPLPAGSCPAFPHS